MYYSDITNSELQYFRNRPVHNFSIKLSDLLTSPLFQVEEIITDSIYRVYPLFYTNEITSTNSNDKILDNKCIICQKQVDETFLTFKSNNDEVVDYSEYGTYYAIEDSLTTAQFNAFISLLRQNIKHNDNIRLSDSVTGLYGNYEFDLTDTTVLDNGIVVTDETITAEPKVRLTDKVFNGSKYILQLSVLHYTGVNILDDTTEDFKVVDTLEITLENDEWVTIPVEQLEQGYIIDLDAVIVIDHTAPIIQDYPQVIHLTADTDIIQTNEELDLTATVKDSIKGLNGQTVYFYEEYEPYKVDLTGDKSIMQSGDTLDLTAKLKDEDGSLVEDEEIYFYVKED